MNINYIIKDDNEKPLDTLIPSVSFLGIFRRIGCVGDSMASGEMESLNEENVRGFHDYFEYSWGSIWREMQGWKF